MLDEMNLCRLLVAVAIVCPREKEEPQFRYHCRILLIAKTTIEAMEIYKEMGEGPTSGSDFMITNILQEYYNLTMKAKEGYENIR